MSWIIPSLMSSLENSREEHHPLPRVCSQPHRGGSPAGAVEGVSGSGEGEQWSIPGSCAVPGRTPSLGFHGRYLVFMALKVTPFPGARTGVMFLC